MLRREFGSPAALGFLGAVLVALGSVGVGWLGPGSSAREWTIIAMVRNSDLAVHSCTIMAIGGGLIIVIAWLMLGRSIAHTPETALRRVVMTSIVWASPLLFTLPLYTRDLFAYVGQGRLMVNGFNPYLDGISAVQGWFNIGVDPMWANAKTPYGPFFIGIEQLVVQAVGPSPLTAVALFRIISVISVAALGYYAYRIAVLRGFDPAKTLWMVLASPVILFNFIVGGHNDSLMLALIVAGVYYASVRHPIVGILLVTAATGVKPIALLALPIVGLIWAGSNRSWRDTLRCWAITAAIAVGGLGVLGFIVGIGFGWVETLSTPTAISHWYAPVNILAIGVGGAFATFGLDGVWPQDLIKIVALGLAGVLVIWIMLTRRKTDPLLRLALAFGSIVILSPVIHPWYAAWVLVLFAIAGVRAGLQTHFLISGSIFFACVSIAEGMDISNAVEGDPFGYVVRNLIIVGGGIAIIIAYCLHEGLSIGLLRNRILEANERRKQFFRPALKPEQPAKVDSHSVG